MEPDVKEPSNSLIKWLKDVVAGSIGGIVCKTVEYPLDTVKVIMQTQERPQRTADCFREVIRTNGFMGLYRGLASPLLGSMVENGVLFSVYGLCKTSMLVNMPETATSFMSTLVPSILAGVAVTAVITPVELVKCRLQVQVGAGHAIKYKGPWDCFIRTVREEGLIRGLYRGGGATLAREIPGNFAWFSTYEATCKLMRPPNGTHDSLGPWHHMFAGGLSGMAYWTAFFPADTVKSCVQTNPAMARLGFWGVMGAIYRAGGIPALYRGWTVTVSRAMPSNALLFVSFEMVEKLLRHI
eukprot:m.25928 g.25928  ORF g.25928 m.25928 type:complete len:297 (-) comp4221_c0_seq1:288-1178(-)